MADPHIQVLVDDTELTFPVREALSQIRATLDMQRLEQDASDTTVKQPDARLVVTTDIGRLTNGRLEKLKGWVRHNPCPTVICSPSSTKEITIPDLAKTAVSVACLHNPTRDLLLGHLAAMCAVNGSVTAMRREVATLRIREEALREKVRRLAGELRRAGELQRDLLPRDLPCCEGLNIHTLYRPADIVSGDTYDVVQISPTKTAFSLADATGHGVAAGLLCATFVRSLCRAAITRYADRDIDPASVLSYLNRELCAADLSECLFVTAVQAVYDESTGVVRLARAGAPYPVFLRRGAESEVVCCEGPAAGMVENASFETVEITMEPGDTLVFHTDGLEHLVIGSESHKRHTRLDETTWFQSLEGHPFRQSLIDLDGMVAAATLAGTCEDDITVLALERSAAATRRPGIIRNVATETPESALAV